MPFQNLFSKNKTPKLKKGDVVRVKVLVDRHKRSRIDPSVPYAITYIDKKKEVLCVTKHNTDTDRGIDSWVLFFNDVEHWIEK